MSKTLPPVFTIVERDERVDFEILRFLIKVLLYHTNEVYRVCFRYEVQRKGLPRSGVYRFTSTLHCLLKIPGSHRDEITLGLQGLRRWSSIIMS